MKYLNCLIFVLVFLAAGCSSGRPTDQRLLEISEQVSDHPDEVLKSLNRINVDSMKESDRMFHALMRIKAQDKAYVKHTSDSIILQVVDYYLRHRGSGLYPEALYYGGRVYSDIGDAPTALRYFQDALDALPEGKDDRLRAFTYSQTGSLLNSIRLYNEAEGYVKKAIKIMLQRSDSLNAMRNMQLLGAVYMHSGKYDRADSAFLHAREIAVGILHRDTVLLDMYLAGTEAYRGNMMEAKKRIGEVLRIVPERRRDIVYSYASQIYLEAGVLDSAYLLAVRLTGSKNNDYRRIGYCLLLNPELRKYSSLDSLLSYSLSYREVEDEYLDRHDALQATIQTSLYNYNIHQRERNRAEDSMRMYRIVAGGAGCLILLLCIVILYLRNRSISNLLQYRKALDDIALLRQELSLEFNANSEDPFPFVVGGVATMDLAHHSEETQCVNDLKTPRLIEDKEQDVLREKLKTELLALQKAGEARKEIPESLLASNAYRRLLEYRKLEKSIPDSDSLWCDLECEVLNVSPEFKSRLYLLAGDRLKEDAYHMAMLVKCGMSPTALTVLVGRSKGAISSRRGYICEMIFGEKLGAKVMDDIIRLL